MHELLKVHLTRRKVDPARSSIKTPEKASGNTLRQTIVLRQGVDADLARQLVREIKDSKLKVQVAVQGGELRVTGKKRDDLQAAIARGARPQDRAAAAIREFPRLDGRTAPDPAALDRARRQPLSNADAPRPLRLEA